MSFGKKDVRSNELQKLTILAAARLYERELAVSGRQLAYKEIAMVVKLAARNEQVELRQSEFETVLNGAVGLAKDRLYIGDIVRRWSRGRTKLGYDDIMKAREFLEDTEQRRKDFIGSRY
jgi:hypothetical protein